MSSSHDPTAPGGDPSLSDSAASDDAPEPRQLRQRAQTLPDAPVSLRPSRPGGVLTPPTPPSEPENADSASEVPAGSAPAARAADEMRPTYLFLGIVAALTLFLDISTKVWAEIVLNRRGFEPINIIGDNVNITLAYNQGGAWGLFAGADESIRLPFFLGVSVFAIFFIVSLYSRLLPSQRALKWGLPLVLGGALGNLSDRITRSQVVDFIDYRAQWVMDLNAWIARFVSNWSVTDHWPTFNVADIAICVGVGLMGVDMFTHRHRGSGRHSGVRPDSEQPDSEDGAPESRQGGARSESEHAASAV